MNSLVVFLSVMALAAAKPSVIVPANFFSYTPALVGVGASAVSHQSRVDIKSTPTIVSTRIEQPIARTVFVAPSVAAPAPYVAAPLAYHTPLAYSAPVAIAPAAVSHQSRVDVKSSPAVVNTVVTAPFYKTLIPASTFGYVTPFNYPTIFNSAAIAPVAIAGPAPVAAKPEAPAEASAELPEAPADTPEVVAARAAHLEAKAEIEEAHKIQKRSAVIVPTPIFTSYPAHPITKYAATPFIYPGAHISTFPAPIVRYY